MSGHDGTGPMGAGSMTGGGRGYCSLPTTNGQQPVRGGYFGRRRGFKRGLGRGFRRGLGFGWRQAGYAYGNPYFQVPYAPNLSPQEESAELKIEAKAMQDEINAMNQRIKELESNTSAGGNE